MPSALHEDQSNKCLPRRLDFVLISTPKDAHLTGLLLGVHGGFSSKYSEVHGKLFQKRSKFIKIQKKPAGPFPYVFIWTQTTSITKAHPRQIQSKTRKCPPTHSRFSLWVGKFEDDSETHRMWGSRPQSLEPDKRSIRGEKHMHHCPDV